MSTASNVTTCGPTGATSATPEMPGAAVQRRCTRRWICEAVNRATDRRDGWAVVADRDLLEFVDELARKIRRILCAKRSLGVLPDPSECRC
jgi:hypothetical protein